MDRTEFEHSRRIVDTRSARVACVDVGEGPAVVFIHGVFLNGYLWRHVIEELRTERRCIAIDAMAHGATTIDDDQDLSIDAQATMLKELLDALSLGDIDLVVNDTGGAVGQVFAARNPERLRTLTFTNCDTHDNFPPERFKPVVEVAAAGGIGEFASPMLHDLSIARSELGFGVGLERPEELTFETAEVYLAPLLSTPERIRQLERYITALGTATLEAVLPQLRQLDVPTLIVWGTADVFFGLSDAYALRDLIPGAREVVELDGAKLFFPEERATELVDAMRGLWASLPVSR